MKKLAYSFFFFFSIFTCFSQTNLKIGLGAGPIFAKSDMFDFSGYSHSEKSGGKNIRGILLGMDMDGKNSFSIGINWLETFSVSYISPTIYEHRYSSTIKEIPFQYSHFFYLTKKIYVSPSAGFFLNILHKSWSDIVEKDSNDVPTITLMVKRYSTVNFTLGGSLSLGIKFRKLGSLEIIGKYNQAFFPMYNYEFVTTNPAPNTSSVNVYGTYKSVEIAYYFPLIRLKKKEEKKE